MINSSLYSNLKNQFSKLPMSELRKIMYASTDFSPHQTEIILKALRHELKKRIKGGKNG